MNMISYRSLILTLLMIPLLIFSSEVADGARYGLLLWYNSVVPSLFPFMVLSEILVSSGGIGQMMTPFHWMLHPFLGLSREGCYVLISGLLCGYPVGAKICAEFVQEGKMTVKEGTFLMSICNHPSPMFLLGYFHPFFANHITVPTLLFTVYAPLLPLGLLAKQVYSFRPCKNASDKITSEIRETTQAIPRSTDEAIISAIEILCKIGGYLILFSIAIVLIRKLPFFSVPIKLCLIGMMEMTTGIRALAELPDQHIAYIASIAALTFGGLSGFFQIKSVLGNKKTTGLSIRPYLFWKLAHAILSAGLAYLLCNRN